MTDKKYPLKIKSLMKLRQISIDEFAKQLQKSARTIDNYLAGNTTPDIDTILKMCRILRINIFELLGDDYKEFNLIKNYRQKYYSLLEDNKRKQDELITTQRKLLNLLKMRS